MLKDDLKKLGKEIGFDLIGFCLPEIEKNVVDAYQDWINKKFYAGMDYMQRTKDLRIDPKKLLPGVKSVISVALSYSRNLTPCKDILDKNKQYGQVAQYALSRDYHNVFRTKLKNFRKQALLIFEKYGYQGEIVTGCDTKPILERYFAAKAGLGFIGRNTLLITKEYGSYVLLGTLLTTVPIKNDEEGKGTCGKCTRCIDSCPTGAIVSEKVVDANKCISYWTIEHRGTFPEHVKKKLAGKLFGCDICQEVCPYNRRALKVATQKDMKKIRHDAFLDVQDILSIESKDEFFKRFSGTPLMRAGFNGLKRNAQAVLENSQ